MKKKQPHTSAVFVICGVSASGKSTIGRLLATELKCIFLEGDDFHPAKNIKKMKSAIALSDNDRVDWIAAISEHVNSLAAPQLVLSCSALTPFVQSELRRQCKSQIYWINLTLPQHVALERSRNRKHFMPPELMASQYEAWTPPEAGINVDAMMSQKHIIDRIMGELIAL